MSHDGHAHNDNLRQALYNGMLCVCCMYCMYAVWYA
jgi:hypothetical protein